MSVLEEFEQFQKQREQAAKEEANQVPTKPSLDVAQGRGLVTVGGNRKEDANLNLFEQKEAQKEVSSKIDANKLVDNMFNAAAVAVVKEDEGLQERIKDTAKKFAETKMEIIAQDVDTERKSANFQNKKNACECFGYKEKQTAVWAVNYMNMWHNVMTAIWIAVGMVTFAPITFIGKKLNVIIKYTWLAMFIGFLIWLSIWLVPILVPMVRGGG